jgi:hypothetical protein
MENSENAIARKDKNDAYLSSLGISTNRHLPHIEDESEVVVKSAQDVAKRTIILFCFTAVAQGVDSERAISWLKQEGLWDDVLEPIIKNDRAKRLGRSSITMKVLTE